LGNYYLDQYGAGNSDVTVTLAAEEANLLHARQLARRHGGWDRVTSTMQGLRVRYDHTGRRAEWARLVVEIVPEFLDPHTDGPLPGREADWSLVTEYRARLAREMRDWPEAERLQRVKVDWDRRRAERVLDVVLSRSPDRDRGTTEALPPTDDESRPEQGDLRSGEWHGQETMPQQTETMPQPSQETMPQQTFLNRIQAVATRLTDADRLTIYALAVSVEQFGHIQRECQQETCVAAYEEIR
jgi:hypothetical protein